MKILLGVTGSIAAYKAYDLTRELSKLGNEVIIILTHGAEQFIKKETFTYLGAKKVYSPSDDFNTEKYENFSVLHIELAKWADRLVIVPATANKISQLSHGYAPDLLSSVFLAFDKTTLIFPAMNTKMLNNKLIQDNIKRLTELDHVYMHGTQSGLLACGDIGEGKLEDIDIILDITLTYSTQKVGKKVLITTGSTIAAIDPVRFISNPSSGLTGYELAKTFLRNGYEVILLAGYNPHMKVKSLEKFPHLTYISVTSTKDMFAAVKEYINEVDIYISAAAISDIEFQTNSSKLKKDQELSLPQMQSAQDILKYVVENRKNQKIIGFSAETDHLEENMQNKIKRKPVDYLVGNLVSNGSQSSMLGFMGSENNYIIMDKNNTIEKAKFTKSQLADRIFNLVKND